MRKPKHIRKRKESKPKKIQKLHTLGFKQTDSDATNHIQRFSSTLVNSNNSKFFYVFSLSLLLTVILNLDKSRLFCASIASPLSLMSFKNISSLTWYASNFPAFRRAWSSVAFELSFLFDQFSPFFLCSLGRHFKSCKFLKSKIFYIV